MRSLSIRLILYYVIHWGKGEKLIIDFFKKIKENFVPIKLSHRKGMKLRRGEE